MTTDVNVKTLFDGAAAGHDRARRQLVPSFDDFYGAVVGEIPYEREVDVRVLDLGVGTGLLSALVARLSLSGDHVGLKRLASGRLVLV